MKLSTLLVSTLFLTVSASSLAVAQVEVPATGQGTVNQQTTTDAVAQPGEGIAEGADAASVTPANSVTEAAADNAPAQDSAANDNAVDGDVVGAADAAEAEGEDDHASGGHAHLEKQDWSFTGIFGTYDRGALQRGFQVYRQVCASCHSMDRLAYRDLAALGYTEGQIKTIAAESMITDGPNDEGDMYERPGRPSDRFKAPFANKQQASFANGGAYPPDMSLLVKARHGGADYIYALMTGYGEAPAGTTLMDGQYWNAAMHGHIISMAPPLAEGMIAYEDGADMTVEQYARDVAEFMAWASEPHMEVRKQTGIKVFLFLLVFTGIMYGVKKKVWKTLH